MARKTIVEATTQIKKGGTRAAAAKATPELGNEVRKNGKMANTVPVSLEEEIRRRAYELYLERRATAGAESGSEGQDWLIAEREIRLRHGNQGQHTA